MKIPISCLQENKCKWLITLKSSTSLIKKCKLKWDTISAYQIGKNWYSSMLIRKQWNTFADIVVLNVNWHKHYRNQFS